MSHWFQTLPHQKNENQLIQEQAEEKQIRLD
jgi:hypothetical protein